jgi:hypothetical protein
MATNVLWNSYRVDTENSEVFHEVSLTLTSVL